MRSTEPSRHDLDLIVVGSGIAGLFAAVAAHDAGERVLIVTKAAAVESNTRYAQGGIAVAMGDGDSGRLHAFDTIACGGDINDPLAVETLTAESRSCVEQLIDVGILFDQHRGRLSYTREAAHSVARVLHAGGDATGFSITRGLVAAVRARGIPMLEQRAVVELLSSDGPVHGIRTLDSENQDQRFEANRVLLASGGAGQLFSRTTNPSVATGDGLALAFVAGAQLMDLEFFQFHPTALAMPGRPSFLITEAARGEGAALRDGQGRRFAFDYHSDGELAPRDIVARAIWSEMSKTGSSSVGLDLTHLSRPYLQTRFPTIWDFCSGIGLDISQTPIPVAPAAHYFMGGVRTDENGATTVPGLWAAGEAACTGVHGANRLASNSLLEGLVFGRRAALAPTLNSDSSLASSRVNMIREWSTELGQGASPSTREQLQETNWEYVGLVRDEVGLRRRRDMASKTSGQRPDELQSQVEDANLALVSRLMVEAALSRTESRGAHFRADYPDTSLRWKGHVVLDLNGMYFEPLKGSSPDRERLADVDDVQEKSRLPRTDAVPA